MSSLEKGKYTIAYSSGCAAITTLMMTLKTGEEVISIDDVYGGSRRLFDKVFFKNFKVKYTYLNFDKL